MRGAVSMFRWSRAVVGACLVLVGLVLAVTGCGRRTDQAASPPEPTGPEATAATADAGRAEPAAEQPEVEKPTSRETGTSDIDIEAELAETQKQLDQMVADMERQSGAPDRPGGTGGGRGMTERSQVEPLPRSADQAEGTVLIGRILVVSNVPDPSTVPYKDCVTFIKYSVQRVESGDYEGGELLAVFWGMRDGKLQPAARFRTGQQHRLTIQPFAERQDLARVMQADDTNEFSLTPYWVIKHTGA